MCVDVFCSIKGESRRKNWQILSLCQTEFAQEESWGKIAVQIPLQLSRDKIWRILRKEIHKCNEIIYMYMYIYILMLFVNKQFQIKDMLLLS